jgi:hypothetical protein
MAINKKAGRKVDLHEIEKIALESARRIESWSKDGKNEEAYEEGVTLFKRPARSAHTVSVKNKYYKRLATTIKNRLHDDKRKSKSSRIALSTYHPYLSSVRKHLQRELNLKSVTLSNDIKKLKLKHEKYADLFEQVGAANAEMIKTVRADTLKELGAIDNMEAEDAYNDLASLNVYHMLISELSMTNAQKAKRSKSISDNRVTRKQQATTLKFNQISAIISECLDSDNFYELAVGIALVTGRRAIECIHTGIFKASKNKHDISFSGVAKKSKTYKGGTFYNLPLLVESKIIINTVDKLRATDRYKNLASDIASLHKDDQNTVINRRVAGGLNKTIRRLFDNDNLVFKDSRTIAGHIAVEKMYKEQKRYNTLDIGAFRTMYFIHDTFEEAVNYEHIKIDFNAPYDANKRKTAKDNSKLEKADTSALEAITAKLRQMPKKGMRPVFNLHEKAIKVLKEHGAFALSKASIYKSKKIGGSVVKIGGSKPVITRYMELDIVIKAIAEYNEMNNLKTRAS